MKLRAMLIRHLIVNRRSVLEIREQFRHVKHQKLRTEKSLESKMNKGKHSWQIARK